MGFYGPIVGKSGKRPIVFKHGGSFSGVPLRIPCGQCIGCRLEHSRQWAMRCMHEKQLYSDNVFLTLTYDNANLPEDGSLDKLHFTLFMKRLRKRIWKDQKRLIRFYACGEYGEKTMRPHYHALLFNCEFYDKKLYERGQSYNLYTSETVSELWPFGDNRLGDVTFETAAYVARYVVKKVRGPDSWQAYQWVHPVTGVIYDRVPEYTVMSRMPGIGMEWFRKFGAHAYAHDSVIVRGKAVKPPRFYDGKYELLDSAGMARVKRKRVAARIKSRGSDVGLRGENTPERRRVREEVEARRLDQGKRVI